LDTLNFCTNLRKLSIFDPFGLLPRPPLRIPAELRSQRLGETLPRVLPMLGYFIYPSSLRIGFLKPIYVSKTMVLGIFTKGIHFHPGPLRAYGPQSWPRAGPKHKERLGFGPVRFSRSVELISIFYVQIDTNDLGPRDPFGKLPRPPEVGSVLTMWSPSQVTL
jgi:hypothetical protein